MAGFAAATSVKVPDYDLNPYVDAVGEVPEPSIDQIEDFYNTARDIALEQRAAYERMRERRIEMRRQDWRDTHLEGEALPPDSELPEELSDLVRERLKVEEAEAREIDRRADLRQREALSALCSGTPSTEQLIALPVRVLEAFAGYIEGFYSPEARAAATRT